MADGGEFLNWERFKVFCLGEGPPPPPKKKPRQIPGKSHKIVLSKRSDNPTLNSAAAAMAGQKHKLLGLYAVFCTGTIL
jgi:hypothetical protein